MSTFKLLTLVTLSQRENEHQQSTCHHLHTEVDLKTHASSHLAAYSRQTKPP